MFFGSIALALIFGLSFDSAPAWLTVLCGVIGSVGFWGFVLVISIHYISSKLAYDKSKNSNRYYRNSGNNDDDYDYYDDDDDDYHRK